MLSGSGWLDIVGGDLVAGSDNFAVKTGTVAEIVSCSEAMDSIYDNKPKN